MKKNTFKLATATNSTSTLSLENTLTAGKVIIMDNALPNPPSEETVARLNAIAREYPFCAYMKQNDNMFLL